mgnify:CR=1 FL=1
MSDFDNALNAAIRNAKDTNAQQEEAAKKAAEIELTQHRKSADKFRTNDMAATRALYNFLMDIAFKIQRALRAKGYKVLLNKDSDIAPQNFVGSLGATISIAQRSYLFIQVQFTLSTFHLEVRGHKAGGGKPNFAKHDAGEALNEQEAAKWFQETIPPILEEVLKNEPPSASTGA